MTFGPNFTLSSFLPTSEVFPRLDEPESFYMKINQVYIDTANAMNIREVGRYDNLEVITGKEWFGATAQKKRTVFRRVYSIGAVVQGATVNTAHGLTQITAFTHIYGTVKTLDVATGLVTDYRPLPYVSTVAANQQISLRVTTTNIEIINGAASGVDITSGFVVLEYLKN